MRGQPALPEAPTPMPEGIDFSALWADEQDKSPLMLILIGSSLVMNLIIMILVVVHK